MDQKVFSFNAYKHHLLFVRHLINDLSEKKISRNIISFLDEIRQIGNNVMDLYSGNLTVKEILKEVENHVNPFRYDDKRDYKQWMGNPDYKTLKLSDNSYWILRVGLKDEAFIHIHPARYGEHITRLTGSAWKTAMAVALIKNKIPANHADMLSGINFVRTNHLDLPPVKKIIPGSNLERALKLLLV
jgi:hypothetical protein